MSMTNKIATGILIWLSLLSYSTQIAAGGDFPAMVRTDTAIEIEMAPSSWMPGSIVGRYDSNIAAEVQGKLLSVVEVGDRLEAGQTLATIDSTTYQLNINEIKAELMPLEAELGFYERESDRLQKLEKQNNAAKNRLDEIQMNRDQTVGKIRIVKARLARARDEYSKTIIPAPFAGIVVERFKSSGERVESGDTVVRLVDTGRLEVQVRIPIDAIANIRSGDTLRVTDGKQEIQSKVRALVPVGDQRSRLYEVRLEYSGEQWPVGHAVRVAIPNDSSRSVIAVPRDALVIRSDGIVVYRVNGEGVSESVKVTTGIANDTHIEVSGGVQPGDKIVVRGNERLRPGQKLLIQTGADNT